MMMGQQDINRIGLLLQPVAEGADVLVPVTPELILNYISERVLGLPRSY